MTPPRSAKVVVVGALPFPVPLEPIFFDPPTFMEESQDNPGSATIAQQISLSKVLCKAITDKRIASARKHYTAFQTAYAPRIALKRKRLQAASQDRLWRADLMRLVEIHQAHILHDTIRQEIIEMFERAIKECVERALAECAEAMRRIDERVERQLAQQPEGNFMVRRSLEMTGEDEEQHSDTGAILSTNNSTIANSRPRRNATINHGVVRDVPGGQAPFTAVSSTISTSLNTMLTDAEIWDDLQMIFPEEVSRSGYPRRTTKNATVGSSSQNIEVRFEAGVCAWISGQRIAKGDRLQVSSIDIFNGIIESIWTGVLVSILASELILRPDTLDGRQLDDTERNRLRIPLHNLRTGRFQIIADQS